MTRDKARAALFLLFCSFSTPSKSAIRKFQIIEEEVKPSLFADKKKKVWRRNNQVELICRSKLMYKNKNQLYFIIIIISELLEAEILISHVRNLKMKLDELE